MMKLILLLLTLAVFWIVCEDDKDDIDDLACNVYEVCCVNEIATMVAASEELEKAMGDSTYTITDIMAEIESVCESVDAVIECAGDARII